MNNRILAGPETAAEVVAIAQRMLEAVDTTKLKRDHVQAIEFVFSLPAGSGIDEAAFFGQCLAWLRNEIPLPVLSFVCHFDEAAPHAHALLLPVKAGKHIGGNLCDKSSVKDLTTDFFEKVAGPAGLKRSAAKFHGQTKKWATAAVLRECEAMGLPGANGPLWGLLRAVIERDPTEAVRLLGIDVNAMRPREVAQHVRAIALDRRPIALEERGANIQELSCVALAKPTPPTEAPKAPQAMPARGATPATTTPATMLPTERLSVAHAAQQCAMAKHRKPGRVKAPPMVVTDPDGYTRDRGDTHDLSAWD